MENRRIALRLALVATLALAAVAVAVLLTAVPATATITGDAPPASGDWVVNNPTTVTNEPSIVVVGNIIIKNTLSITDSTISLAPTYDGEFKVNVTSTGKLTATRATFMEFNTDVEYTFLVYGETTLTSCLVTGMYDGIQVMTDKKVMIDRCQLIDFNGRALYLNNANGTTVKDCTVQTDKANLVIYDTIMRQYSDSSRSMYFTISGGGVIYVKGGSPLLSNIDLSVNGSMRAYVAVYDYYYYGYYYVTLAPSVVGIESKAMKTVSGINIRDCKFDYWVQYACWGYAQVTYYSYFYMYTGAGITAVNVINYGDVLLENCTVSGVTSGSITDSGYEAGGTNSYSYIYLYRQGGSASKLFAATIDEKPKTAGPHNYKLTLRGGYYEKTGILTYIMKPDYSGSVAPTFHSEVIIDRVEVNGGGPVFDFSTSPMFSMMKTIETDIRITNSLFANTTQQIYSVSRSAGPGASQNTLTFECHEKITFDNCTFRKCRGNYLFYDYYYTGEYNNIYDVNLTVSNSLMEDNYLSSYMWYMYRNYYMTKGSDQIALINTRVVNNTGYYLGMFYYNDVVNFIGNHFEGNSFSYYTYWMDYGGDSNGKKPCTFRFNDNVWRRNTFGYAQMGAFYVYHAGDFFVEGNDFQEVEVYVFSLYVYTYYSGVANLYFRNNYISRCNASIINYYYNYIYVMDLEAVYEDNLIEDTNAPLTDYRVDSYITNYDYPPTNYFRNNTARRVNGTVYKMYGKNTITGNTFTDCRGYVIHLDHLRSASPIITDNVISGCKDVYYIGAKSLGYLKMTLSVNDLYVDCTGNAFYFRNVDVTFENVTVTDNTTIAIIAEDSTVDVTKSSIPVGSGEVIGEGSITVWYDLEVYVYWSNATAPKVSSGVRVSEALVVLYGSSGAYYTSDYTDVNGHLRPMRLPQWSIEGAFMNIWSPYGITVAKSSVTHSMEVDLFRDYVGEDSLVFLLVDSYVPVIRITSPFPQDVISAAGTTLHGFVTEVGSGINKVETYFTDADGNDLPSHVVEVDENGDFTWDFKEMPEGDNIVMHAVVWDVAKNMNETSVSIIIDRTPPALIVTEPKNGLVTNVQDVQVKGTYETGAKVRINGLEREGPYTGILSEMFQLAEGNNTIVVEVEDRAGNTASVALFVKLDRFAPTLTVLDPRDGLITKVTNISVEGDVELGPRITITVSVMRDTGDDLVDEPIEVNEDGTFSHRVDLAEGKNTIIVRAWDIAKNQAEVTRVVMVDTMLPMCKITLPADGFVTNLNTVRVVGTADIGSTLYLNGKQIYNDGKVDRTVNLNEGPNVIELRAVDAIGNEYRHRITVTLDTKAPTIIMTRPIAELIMTNTGVVELVGTVVGGVNTLTVMGNDVAVTGDPAEFTTTVTLTTEGMIEVVLEAKDLAGNRATHTIMVDFSTAKPSLSVVYQPAVTSIEGPDSNLYITGITTPGIREVVVTQTAGGKTTSTPYRVVGEDGAFSVVKILEEGQNTFVVKVTDSRGNTMETQPYMVNYKYKAEKGPGAEEDIIQPEAVSGVIIAVSIALLVTAVVVTRSFRQRK